MASPSELPPDTLLAGKIRLIQRIGRGGMGDVWVARNEATQAEVAVKTLQRSERRAVHDERFRREARLAATISHRNVVRIFDLVDEEDGTLALVMELLRGGTLETCLRERGSLSTVHAVAVVLPILSALHHVHDKGIVHRDVKPGNIFFAVEPDGHVIPKILDFGIAKLPAAGSALTMDGSVLGTPHYMSPEQIRGQDDIDGRSDMFSVAVVLYEMLTAVRVFERDTAAASLAAVLEHEVDPDPRIEPKVWLVLSRALAKRPYERYAHCGELATALREAVEVTDQELQQALQDLRPRADVPTTTTGNDAALGGGKRRRDRPSRTRLVGLALGAIGFAAVVGVSAAYTLSRGTAPTRAEDLAATTAPEAPSAPSHQAVEGDAPPPVEARDPEPPVETNAPAAETAKPAAKPVRPPAASGAKATSSTPRATTTTTGAKVKPIATHPGF